MPETKEVKEEKQESQALSSKLPKGREHFLSCVIQHAFETGRRTPADFLRHFPPHAIMSGLKDHPNLRANILELTAGTKRKIAEKKSWESCAEDLEIALEERETDPEAVVTLFAMDDRVRYLDHQALWRFLTEGEFWRASEAHGQAFEVAKSHLVFMIELSLQDKLMSHRDVVEGIRVEELARRLPKARLGEIIQAALDKSRSQAAFSEVDLLASMPASELVNFVPLAHIWKEVIVPSLAERHDYVAKSKEDEQAADKAAKADAAPASIAKPGVKKSAGGKVSEEEPAAISADQVLDATDLVVLPSDAPPM